MRGGIWLLQVFARTVAWVIIPAIINGLEEVMKTKVTEQGVLIPKQMLGDMDEVEILKQDGMVIVVPARTEDPIFQLGKYPVTADVTDGSENLDRYLYDAL